MSRQADLKAELRESARRDEVVAVLEFALAGNLKMNGIDLLGFAIRYEEFNCLLTIKAEINDKKHVAFVGSDTMMNCILKAGVEARSGRLKWRPDRYA